jgi:hypothetical protein
MLQPGSAWADAVTQEHLDKASANQIRISRRYDDRKKPELGLHFGGIGHSFRDFLAKKCAIPLAKPVNGYQERFL